MPTRILVRVDDAAAAAALPDVAMSAAAADVFPTKEEVGEIEDEILPSEKRAAEEWLHKEQPRPLLHPRGDGVVQELFSRAGYHDCFSKKRAAEKHMLLQPPKMQPPTAGLLQPPKMLPSTDGVQQQRWERDAKVAVEVVDEFGLAPQKKRTRMPTEQPPAANTDTDKDVINTNHPINKKICSAEGCSKGVQAGGVCWKHMDQFKVCRAEECNEPARTRGLCIRHDALRLVCSYRGCANQVCRSGLCMRHGNCTQKPECRVEGCTKPVVKGGVCYRHGPKRPICNFRGCANQQKRHGFCVKHIKLSSDTTKSGDGMLKFSMAS